MKGAIQATTLTELKLTKVLFLCVIICGGYCIIYARQTIYELYGSMRCVSIKTTSLKETTRLHK
jgi:hypothetical protein